MVESMGHRSQVSAIYSPKWWLGTGLVYDRLSRPDSAFKADIYTVQAAALLKRWNLTYAQGNVYAVLASGVLKNSFDESAPIEEGVLKYGLRADYETRSFYIAADYFDIWGFDSEKSLIDNLTFSIGLAPYVAGYEDLNTWFIAKVQWHNNYKNVDIFPTARFFYKNVLWEVGQSLKGEGLFTFMMRF